VLIIRLNIGLVFVVITVHVPIHEAHPQCSRTGLTLGVINILVIHIVSRGPAIRIWCGLLPDPALRLRSRVNLVFVVYSKGWSACKRGVSGCCMCHFVISEMYIVVVRERETDK